MTLQTIAAAMQRVEDVLGRKPGMAIQDDASATSRWHGGLRFVSHHPRGIEVATDLGPELGGSGGEVSPGWLMRAGLAACAATSIVLSAAAAGIELTRLEVVARSRSDTRGILGMPGIDGAPVDPAPCALELHVRIAARGATQPRLLALVDESQRRSPVPCALRQPVPIALHVDVEAG
jgi:uncharacterized OsmC-like protein